MANLSVKGVGDKEYGDWRVAAIRSGKRFGEWVVWALNAAADIPQGAKVDSVVVGGAGKSVKLVPLRDKTEAEEVLENQILRNPPCGELSAEELAEKNEALHARQAEIQAHKHEFERAVDMPPGFVSRLVKGTHESKVYYRLKAEKGGAWPSEEEFKKELEEESYGL